LLALADMEGLPPSHHGVDRHAPCPCCSPKSPKFYKNGKIAWFPDEHVIRMIGPDCFQTLNPEGHWEAVEVFNREEAERRTIAYLVANLHLNVPTRDVIQRALPILEAVDHVHTVLQQRISEVLRLDIWRHVGRGTLSVNVEGRRMKRNRDGSQEVESFLDIQQLSEFPGYQMFSPRNSRLASRVGGFARRLSLIDFGNEVEERVRAMTTEEQAKAARILSSGISSAAAIFAEADGIRDGFKPMSIAALKGWTRHAGCPIHLFVSGDESNFDIGTDEQHELRIEIPPAFWRGFGDLPVISTVAAWDEDTA
jgi:hypothetical protein